MRLYTTQTDAGIVGNKRGIRHGRRTWNHLEIRRLRKAAMRESCVGPMCLTLIRRRATPYPRFVVVAWTTNARPRYAERLEVDAEHREEVDAEHLE